MIKVMFVCYGNICRSTMAEFVFKSMVKEMNLDIEVASSGTSTEELGNDTYYLTKAILDEHGIPYTERRAVQITKKDYDYFDYIICMDRMNKRNLVRMFGDAESKISLLMDYTDKGGEVADPWYTRDFETTYKDIKAGLDGFVKEVIKK